MTDVQSTFLSAEYVQLEDGTFVGKIPSCKGVIAFGTTRGECASELRSTLCDWILVARKLGHEITLTK